jgi:hypothetical protein
MTRLEDVKPGDVLIADGGFTCLTENGRCKVREDEHGLYVICDEGKHYLDGQLDDDGTGIIGFAKAEPTPA